ncbi:hypothetical protein cyc_01523 [Cyclospora cayetanensis]|uniref:Uncharacterized protein n=1 Tax=Cyclospora cayetanensis TaxID=88456 RepID=A0A1D3D711_9EIME|nr:hypothetical protein cyc_01523 [Cyclospora cayetanensis]
MPLATDCLGFLGVSFLPVLEGLTGQRRRGTGRRTYRRAVRDFLGLVLLVYTSLTFCLRMSDTTESKGTLRPSEHSLLQQVEIDREPGREKWFMPFIILLAILLAAAIVALCVHCLNVR